MRTDDSQIEDVFFQSFIGQAIILIDAAFINAGSVVNRLRLQRGMTRVRIQQFNRFIHFRLDAHG